MMRVLLIEPDKIFGHITATALEAGGLDVEWRRSGQAAIDSMDTQTPDIIVLEPRLGLHNGIEFLYEIRTYTEWQNIPVVVYSLNTQVKNDTFKEQFRQLGVVEVMYKPRTTAIQLAQAIKSKLAVAL
ncbi:MAG: response regulator [Candidatus Saccharimonadales bacterium]